MISPSLHKIQSGHDLSPAEADALMEELLEGRLHNADIVQLLIALRKKGEAIDELVGFARAMRRHAFPVMAAHAHIIADDPDSPLVDTCGTGGDTSGPGRGTFNVSTAAALVAAGAGARVAKHGNRAFNSRSGSADVLEALGVKLDIPPERAGEAIATLGIGFLFAPAMHSAMKHATAARREAGGRTVFNLLGPLSNPAGATAQVIGVPSPALVDKLGRALCELGVSRAFVVHGVDGVAEISISDQTEVADVRPHAIQRYRISPVDFGIAPSTREMVVGGDATANAAIIRGILEGRRGPQRDFVCINAAAALVAANRAPNFAAATRLAEQAIDSGAAKAKLEALIAFSQQ
jgi:anthranilate phosphoribosyltransferase